MTGEIKLNLDRDGYESFRFNEIAQKISETVDPSTTDVERYVGLEHIDSGDIHIREYGSPDDVKGGKLKCYPGDVIFGKRRAYQRKAALVDFEGICSAHAFVFRANEEVIDPKLFPFFLHSNQFMHRMVDISVGGLSPTINWGDLKGQEFLIPPKDQQAEIAELLWALDRTKEESFNLYSALQKALDTLEFSVFYRGDMPGFQQVLCKSPFQTKRMLRLIPEDSKIVRMHEIISNIQGGFAEGRRDSHGVPQLRMNNVTRRGVLNLEKVAHVPKPTSDKYYVSEGDILFCNTNSEDLVGKSILATSEINGFTFSNHFTRIRVDRKIISSRYLSIWLRCWFRLGLFERLCTRWIGQAAIQSDVLKNLEVIVPPLTFQDQICDEAGRIESRMALAQKAEEDAQSLLMVTINKVCEV